MRIDAADPPPRRKSRFFRILLISIIITSIASISPIYVPTIFHSIPTPPAKNETILLTFPPLNQTHPPPHPPRTLLYKQAHWPGSLGESIRLHSPFYLHTTPSHDTTALLSPHNHTLACSSFTHPHPPFPTSNCTNYLSQQSFSESSLHYPNLLKQSTLHPPTPALCSPTTLLILLTHQRDINTCHLFMRLLFAHNLLTRHHHTPHYLPTPPISHFLLLTPSSRVHRAFSSRTQPHTFHRGLLESLFSNANPIPTIVSKTLSTLNLPPGLLCFSAAIIGNSHANRFAFPDALLGPNMGHDGLPSLPSPLSSDALGLRSAIFHPNPPPRMQNKLLYVHRSRSNRCWTTDGEQKFRSLLRRVTETEGVRLEIFEAKEPWPGFWEQVAMYAEASVIVGFHGAGLATSVVAARGSVLVEIEPEDHRLSLFGNVASGGLGYEMVALSSGTSRGKGGSDLVEVDEERLEKVLTDKVREGKRKVAESEEEEG